jgi:two-component system, LytTR family, sensor kinase
MIIAIWIIVALVFVGQNYVGVLSRRESPRWLLIAGFELEYWLTFLAASPFFFYMASRFPVERDRRWRSLSAHAVGGVAFALIQPVAAGALHYTTLVLLRAGADSRHERLADMVVRYPVLAFIALWKYAIVIGVYFAFDYHRKYRDHELRTAQLERRLALAEVGALRMQLQPHFLFNALNSVSALTVTEPARAYDVLAQLGELLRGTLDVAAEAEVPLARELDFLDRYLSIERVRFEDRLTVRFEVAEDLEDAVVPSLILQPLVENSIHHALAPHSSARTLTIRADAEGDVLYLEVEDDGPGLPPGWTYDRNARTGLTNVQARVNLANDAPRPIEFLSSRPRGLCVRIALPRRHAGSVAA